MVALAVPRLEYVPKLCLARPMLFGALDAFERGDHITAGCKLREAVTRFLVAAADWYAVKLPGRKHPRPADYARALHKAKQLDEWGLEVVLESIAVGNSAAHCQKFCRKSLKGCIAILFAMMDSEPYCRDGRKPHVTSHKTEGYDCDDCDDDDGSGWWKGGAI